MAAPSPTGGPVFYNSYVVDPHYQRYLTVGVGCTLVLYAAAHAPSFVSHVVSGRAPHPLQLVGFRELEAKKASQSSSGGAAWLRPTRHPPTYLKTKAALQRWLVYTPRVNVGSGRQWSSSLGLGAILSLLLIPALILATLLPEARLSENPNRFGFFAVALLPWIYLLGLKSPVSLLALSYDRINYIHRWLGRAVMTLVLCHFGLWCNAYAKNGTTFLKAVLKGEKQRNGIMSMSFMMLLALPSFSFVRNAKGWGWRFFKVLHVVGMVGLVIGINMHTRFAWKHTVGIIVVYAVDVAMRVFRFRFKDVVIEALPNAGKDQELQMVKISVQNVSSGWSGGQHVRIRLLLPTLPVKKGTPPVPWHKALLPAIWRMSRPLESHPFSIANTPASQSTINPTSADLYSAVVSSSGWTSDLHALASGRGKIRAVALIDGPYGGLSPFANFQGNETVLLFAGGSGMSFVLGVLDELVSQALAVVEGKRQGRGSRVKRIELVWMVKDAACVAWFSKPLAKLLGLTQRTGCVDFTLTIHARSNSTSTTVTKLANCCESPNLTILQVALPEELESEEVIDLVSFSDCKCSTSCALQDLMSESCSPCEMCFDCTCREQESEGISCHCKSSTTTNKNVQQQTTNVAVTSHQHRDSTLSSQSENEDSIQPTTPLLEVKSVCNDTTTTTTTDIQKPEPSMTQDFSQSKRKVKVKHYCNSTFQQPQPSTTTTTIKPKRNLNNQSCCGACGRRRRRRRFVRTTFDQQPPFSQRSSTEKSPFHEPPVTTFEPRNGGLGVIVCGPKMLIADVRNAVAAVPISKSVQIGGIQLHSEQYGL